MKRILVLLMLCVAAPMFAQTNVGIDYYLLGEHQKAKKYFESQIAANPAQSYYYLGEIAFAEGDMAKAKEYYSKCAEADQGNALYAIGMAKMNLKSDTKNAIAALDAIAKGNKNNLGVALAIGRAYLDNGMLDKALTKVADAQKINSKAPEICILEGDIIMARGDATKIGEAAGKYEMANYLDPNYHLGYMKTAQVYETNNASVAVENLKGITAKHPDYLPALSLLSKIYANTGYYQKAIEIFKLHSPTTRDDIERYARCLYFTNDFDEAQNIITKGLQENQDDFILNRYQLYIYAKTGNCTEGLKLADRFFSLAEPSRYIHLDYSAYANLLKEAKRYNEALTQYDRAIGIDPENPERYKEASEAAREIKNYGKAADYHKTYIDKKILASDGPDYQGASLDVYLLGTNYYNAGTTIANNSELAAELMKNKAMIEELIAFDNGLNAASLTSVMEYFKTSYAKYYLTKANATFSELMKQAPQSYHGYRFKARSEYALNSDLSNTAPRDYYEKMIAAIIANDKITEPMNDALLEGYDFLAIYYFKTDNNAKAIEYCNKVMELNPEFGNAKAILKELNK